MYIETMHRVHYEVVSGAFTVIDIAEPVRLSVSREEPIEVVNEKFMDRSDWCCLVREGLCIPGFLTFDDDAFSSPLSGSAGEKATPLTPDLIVASSLPLLELVPLFKRHYFFFVLEQADITHVVSFQDLDKLPMKLSIFALFLELETRMIELITQQPFGTEHYLRYLPKNRYAKAKKLCIKKYKEENPQRLLLCTTFSDKKEMLLRDPQLVTKLSFPSKSGCDSLFNHIERVRNQIAHSDSIMRELDSPERLDTFICEVRDLIQRLSKDNQA